MKKLLAMVLLLSMIFSIACTKGNTQESNNDKADDILTITINKAQEQQEIGIINNIYEANGKTYLDMDIVEFYRGEEALNEALIDGAAVYDEELAKYYLPDGYYIRNIDEEITTYELSDDVQYYLCDYDVNADFGGNSSSIVNVSEEQFSEYINQSADYDYMLCNRAKLFRADITNGSITSLLKQYTP